MLMAGQFKQRTLMHNILQGPIRMPDARRIEAFGRGGDTMLAHLRPDQAHFLARMGGAGTLNPRTGLPEYYSGTNFNNWEPEEKEEEKEEVEDEEKTVLELMAEAGVTKSDPGGTAIGTGYTHGGMGVGGPIGDAVNTFEDFAEKAVSEGENIKSTVVTTVKDVGESVGSSLGAEYERLKRGLENFAKIDLVADLNREYTGLQKNMEQSRDDLVASIDYHFREEFPKNVQAFKDNFLDYTQKTKDSFVKNLNKEKDRLLVNLGLEPGDDNRENINEISAEQLRALKDRNKYWETLRDSAKDLPAYERYTGDKAALKEIASKNIVSPTPDELAGIEQYRKLDYEPDTSAMDDALETMKKIQGYTPGSLDVTQAMVNAKMNPYLDKAMERVAQQQAKANQMSGFAAAGSGAFGGSRQAIREAATAKEMGGVAGDLAYKNYMGMYDRLQRQLNTQARLGARGAAGAYGMSKGIQDFRLARGRLKGADLLDIGKLQRGILQARADELYRQQQAKFDASFAQKKSLNRFNMLEWARIQDDPYKILQAQTAVGAAEPIPTTTTT